MELCLPACFASNQAGEGGIEEDGERERGERVCERKTHIKTQGERGGRGSRILLISLLC